MEATASRMSVAMPTLRANSGSHKSAAARALGKPFVRGRKLAMAAEGRVMNLQELSGRPVALVKAEAMGNLMDGRSAEEEEDGGLREECGVAGVYGDPEAGRLCYLALHALQHRGQEGAGIVSADNGALKAITGLGLVSDVFNEENLCQLSGASAIGHVRYATAGASVARNVQPFVAGYRFGSVGVAHNGNLVNYKELRSRLEDQGSIFNTSSDTEVVLHLIAQSKADSFILRLVEAMEQLEGAFSLVFITEDKLVAVRDPHGFRPLVMGRRKNGAVVFASETCALDLIEATYEREVRHGEIVVVDKDGVSSMCLMPQKQRKACVFEHIYFSLPSSVVFGRSVYESRYEFGRILAEEAPVDCDVVIAVPDSGMVAALGYAGKSKVPFQQGLIRSHYVGRTFIEPSQKIRDFGVKLKLAPVRGVLEGKKVVVVDDSIVRGTTSSKIVRMIKDAGAKEVHMRIASPPIIGSCYYGVDTPSREKLISYRMSIEETRKYIGADSLAFLPLHRLREMLGEESPSFCYACFSGSYPVPPRDALQEAEGKERTEAGEEEEDRFAGFLNQPERDIKLANSFDSRSLEAALDVALALNGERDHPPQSRETEPEPEPEPAGVL